VSPACFGSSLRSLADLSSLIPVSSILSALMSQRRITIVNNSNPDQSKLLIIPLNLAIAQFLLLSTQKLHIKAKRLFLADGQEITDVEYLHDGDVIYVSTGEAFFKQTNKRKEANVPTYAVAVMGPGSVGKSAMTRRYVQGVFVQDYDPTIEDAYRKNAMIDRDQCVLDILDTAGQEDYTALRSTWMRERDGFLLVFSLTDRSTFEGLYPFVEQLQAIHEDEISPPPIILVGNKSDLIAERQVRREEGQRWADQYGNSIYVECSALSGEQIDLCFENLVREIRKRRKGKQKREREKRRSWCSIL